MGLDILGFKSQVVGAHGGKEDLGIVYPGIFLLQLYMCIFFFFSSLSAFWKCSGDGIPGNYGPALSPQN